MTYATMQDLVDRFGQLELVQLTDRTNRPPTTPDETTVGLALVDADALIDGYVGKVYELPLPSVPASLVKCAADLARYFLHGKAADKDGTVARNYDQAMRWLRDVSNGLVKLDIGGAEPPQPGGGSVRASRPDRVMTRDRLRGL